jgi:hypothetical protein
MKGGGGVNSALPQFYQLVQNAKTTLFLNLSCHTPTRDGGYLRQGGGGHFRNQTPVQVEGCNPRSKYGELPN